MWLVERRIQDGGAADVDRLDLLRITFPHSDLFVSISPNQHGVGSSRAEGERLRELVDAQGATLARRRHTLRVVNRVLLATLVAAWGIVFLVI
ncbi:MAG TPA: hypothetical protein VET45_17870 [Candidatus Binatia bacterium]|nr:hypothetical protein [Candidatus Binatia bacterium]